VVAERAAKRAEPQRNRAADALEPDDSHSLVAHLDTFTGRVDDIAVNIGRLQRREPL